MDVTLRDGSIWSSDSFGFYIANACENISIHLYEIESLKENPYHIYVNEEEIQKGILKAGMNDITLDLSSFKGKPIYFHIELEKYQDASVDGRILGCIVSGLERDE